ncbi:hypothetical protein BDP55DRAFT_637786 [Colletotrichum godetiae]|uniref:Mid2 domain-containing protein n=1 Tax=Colletotrichum godetiae TaxID=1209918 RepID=A0AAJ0ERI7_9PEZI|nr:uncharacterized protein BDP55DRAFT_637786 [Colletotrichum godetiae]KAK1658564.1 hypothetical protein BDP55DRAFT_637786 [Colletotrichum godetiae]
MYYNWTLPEDLDVTDSSHVISYFNRSIDAANQNLFSSSVFSIRGYQSSLTTTSAQSAATSTPMPTTTSATPVTTSSKSPSFSTAAKIGVSIGVCLTLLLLSAGAYIFLRRRRRGCGTSGTCVEGKRGFEKPELDSADTQHRVELHAEARGHCSPEIARGTEWRLEKEPAELPT